jgi:hypothetical protein
MLGGRGIEITGPGGGDSSSPDDEKLSSSTSLVFHSSTSYEKTKEQFHISIVGQQIWWG